MKQSGKADAIRTIVLHLLLWTLLGGLWVLLFAALRFLSTAFISNGHDWLDWMTWMSVAVVVGWLVGALITMQIDRQTLGYFNEVNFAFGGVSVLLGGTIGATGGMLLELLALLILALVSGTSGPVSSFGWLPNLPPLGALTGMGLALASLAIFGASLIGHSRRRRFVTSRRDRSLSGLERLPKPIRPVVTIPGMLLGLFLMVCYLIALFLVNTLNRLREPTRRPRPGQAKHETQWGDHGQTLRDHPR